MARRCAFCGNDRELTKEHVLPAWMRSLWSEVELSGHVTGGRTENGELSEYIHNAPPFSSVVREVCATCNNGWMSRIEGRAKQTLIQLIQGQRTKLGEDKRAALATWMVKTSLVFQLAHRPPQEFIPSTVFSELKDTGCVPRPVGVWLGRSEDHQAVARHFASIREFQQAAGSATAADVYVVTIALGSLVVALAGEVGALERRVEIGRDWVGFFRRIWPVVGPVAWPPSDGLTRELFDDFTQSPTAFQLRVLSAPGRRSLSAEDVNESQVIGVRPRPDSLVGNGDAR